MYSTQTTSVDARWTPASTRTMSSSCSSSSTSAISTRVSPTQINKKIIAPLASANRLSDFPDFNDAAKLGSGKEMLQELLTGQIRSLRRAVSPRASVGLEPEPLAVDDAHRQWRADVMRAATSCELPFTHGEAAKLVNIYLKSRFVCGGHHAHVRVQCLHPPIDSVLPRALRK